MPVESIAGRPGRRLLRSVVDTTRGTRRAQRGRPRGPSCGRRRGVRRARCLRPGPAAPRSDPRRPEARPPIADPEPRHVRRGGDRRARDRRPRRRRDRTDRRRRRRDGSVDRLRAPDRRLALVHGPVRDLRRGAGGGAGQGTGSDAPPHAVGDDRPSTPRRRHDGGRRLLRPPCRRHHRHPRGRDDPRRRRRHRGRGIRQRGRHHRRVRARPQGARHGHPEHGDRRHAAHERHARRPHHGEPGRDVPRPDDRPRGGCQAAADAERDRPLDPALRADARLPPRDRHAAAVRPVRGRAARDRRARGAPRLPHPHDDRWPALGHRHRRHGPRRALQRARDERARRGGVRRRGRDPPRQDGHDHVRQPARLASGAPAGRDRAGGDRGRPHRVGRRRDARGSVDRRTRPRAASPSWRPAWRRSFAAIAEVVPFSAETRTSGVVLADGTIVLKGAVDAIAAALDGEPPSELKAAGDEIASLGATPSRSVATAGCSVSSS